MPDKTYRAEMARIEAELQEELTTTFHRLGTRFFQEGHSLEEVMALPVHPAMYQIVQTHLPLLICQILLERACQQNQITEAQLCDLVAYLNDLHTHATKGENTQ
ncbi:MAG TPA: hypothetical protein VFB60_11455 [Ktedonobacteraceae bacterium]|nr:hypothetical protein [Ktedonobacteraceae bacterium]